MPVRNARRRLSTASQGALDRWFIALNKGDQVIAATIGHALENERRLPGPSFVGFLQRLVDHYESTNDVEGAWTSASAGFELVGPAAPVPHSVVRVYLRDTLVRLFAKIHGVPDTHASLLVDDLVRTQDRSLLGSLSVGGGSVTWGGLDHQNPLRHPADACSADRLLDLLGLDPDRRRYPRGADFVVVRYRPVDPRVPTVADRGWDNPWWIPSKSGDPWGRARDVGGLTRPDLARPPRLRGLAEVVHQGRQPLSPSVVSGTFAREVP